MYTYVNQGNYHAFNPSHVTSNKGQKITLLDLHKELVKQANRKDVYLLDAKGREVAVE